MATFADALLKRLAEIREEKRRREEFGATLAEQQASRLQQGTQFTAGQTQQATQFGQGLAQTKELHESTIAAQAKQAEAGREQSKMQFQTGLAAGGQAELTPEGGFKVLSIEDQIRNRARATTSAEIGARQADQQNFMANLDAYKEIFSDRPDLLQQIQRHKMFGIPFEVPEKDYEEVSTRYFTRLIKDPNMASELRASIEHDADVAFQRALQLRSGAGSATASRYAARQALMGKAEQVYEEILKRVNTKFPGKAASPDDVLGEAQLYFRENPNHNLGEKLSIANALRESLGPAMNPAAEERFMRELLRPQ